MILSRYLCLLVPIGLVLLAARLDRGKAGRAGALLAFLGAAVGVAALHEIATRAGWWSFAPVEGAFRGLPVDLWLGWALLWGPIPVLLRRFVPVPIALIGLAWVDLLAMPNLEPLVKLGPGWIWGETAGIIGVALPAILAGRWSAQRRNLAARVLLQMGIFAGLTVWLAPHLAFELGDGSWSNLAAHPRPVLIGTAQVALVIVTPAVLAVIEFARRGRGTPYPWDPPDRLITTGPYAYVANPMQLSMVLLLLLMAVLAESWTLAAGAVCAAVFSAAVAAVHERDQLGARFGQQWWDYRTGVRDWLPKPRPYQGMRATLWLDDQCGPCRAIRDQFTLRAPASSTPEPAGMPRSLALASATEPGRASSSQALASATEPGRASSSQALASATEPGRASSSQALASATEPGRASSSQALASAAEPGRAHRGQSLASAAKPGTAVGGLRFGSAAEHERVLWRAQYEAEDGHVERGVAAVARGMEHVHLGWAYLGWLLRLPVLNQLAQIISDALIVAPHPARGEGDQCRIPSNGSSKAPFRRSVSTASPGYPPAR